MCAVYKRCFGSFFGFIARWYIIFIHFWYIFFFSVVVMIRFCFYFFFSVLSICTCDVWNGCRSQTHMRINWFVFNVTTGNLDFSCLWLKEKKQHFHCRWTFRRKLKRMEKNYLICASWNIQVIDQSNKWKRNSGSTTAIRTFWL